MPEPDQFADESSEKKQPSRLDGISRRQVLSSTAATGALLLGMDTAAAHGQGGQAVVFDGDYKPDQSFVIREVDGCVDGDDDGDGDPTDDDNPYGSCFNPVLPFQCDGEGGRYPPGKDGTIPFPYWHFNYVDELEAEGDPDPRKIYTRDNEVKTGATYHWPGTEKYCPQDDLQYGGEIPEGSENEEGQVVLVQTGFVAGSADK